MTMKTIYLTNEQLPYWFDRANFGNRNAGTFWIVKGEPFDKGMLEQAILETVQSSKILCYKINRFFPLMKLSNRVDEIPIQILQCDANNLIKKSRQTIIELLDQPSLFNKPPLIKCYVGLSDRNLWSFGFVCPHIMMDGLSTIKFARAIADNYAAIATQNPRKKYKAVNTYLDFATKSAVRSTDPELEHFWRDYMDKPCDMTVPSSVLASHSTYLEQDLDNQTVFLIEQFSKRSKISLQAVYLYVFQQALYTHFRKEKIYISYVTHGIKQLRYAKTIGNFSRLNFIYTRQQKKPISEQLASIDKELDFLEKRAEISDVTKVYLYESKFWQSHKTFNLISNFLQSTLNKTILNSPQYEISHKYIAKFGSKELLDGLRLLKKENFISPTLVIMPQYKLRIRKRFNQGDIICHGDLEPVNIKVPKNLMYLYLSRNCNMQYRIALKSHIKETVGQEFLDTFSQQMRLLTKASRENECIPFCKSPPALPLTLGYRAHTSD